jgi:hypothetical protein
MKLLNDEIKRTLPPIRGQEHVADPVAHVKFFTPWAGFTWFVTEGEEGGEGDYLFFGRVHGHETEIGYFRLADLESVSGPGGLKVERDLYFKPKPLSALRRGVDY